jgi:hypothetical protein
VPAVDRMASFLAANSSIFTDDAPPRSRGRDSAAASSEKRGHTKKHAFSQTDKAASRARSTKSTRDSGSDCEDPSRDEEDRISVDSLYDRLGGTCSPSPDQDDFVAAPLSRTISDLCNILQHNYPSSPSACHSTFAVLLDRVKAGTENVQEHTAEVLDTAMQVLRTSGNFTLLEVIHFRRDLLPLHVGLLAFILRIMETCTQGYFSRHDCTAFRIFGSPRFLSSLQLQLVDTLYALALSPAWSCDAGNVRALLEQLTPFRDALLARCCLVEEACRLVVEALECQKWRKSDMGHGMFVSSVDPKQYCELITHGSIAPSPPTTGKSRDTGSVTVSHNIVPTNELPHPVFAPTESRYAHFKGAFPRSEINAIWLLLAYFAGGSPSKAIDTSFRWRVIASLFYSDCGVLSKPAIEPSIAEDKALPPSTEHLATCQSELGRFIRLLTVGALDPLPASDGFIVKLFQKTLTLQGAAHMLSDTAASTYIPQIDVRDRRRYVNAAWALTSLASRSFEGSVGDASSSSLVVFCQALRGTAELRGPSTFSSSLILQLGIESLGAWIGRLPAKKARSARFNTALQDLVGDLISRASQLKLDGNLGPVKSESQSAFSAAFGSAPVISGNDANEAFLKEAAVQVILVGAMSRQQSGLPPGVGEKVGRRGVFPS